MIENDIRGVALKASNAILGGSIRIKGKREYILTSNSLWDGSVLITLAEAASTFGIRASERGASGEVLMQCGPMNIDVFDFGLLYSAFSAIVMATSELGGEVSVSTVTSTDGEYEIAAFGNDLVIYSVSKGLIIQAGNRDIFTVCRKRSVVLQGFSVNEEFVLSLDGHKFVLSTHGGEFLCRFPVPEYVAESYRTVFEGEVLADDPTTPWDERSMLGGLIAVSDERQDVNRALENYQVSSLSNAQSRTDLICEPVKKFATPEAIYGSWAYSDKREIVMPISNHNGLLTYTTSLSLMTDEPEIKYYIQPDLSQFYDVSAEFEQINRFVRCVKNLPLTAAQLDGTMFQKIRTAFLGMQLERLKLAQAFGKVVIPESVMVRELGNTAGDALYCIVPLGMIGEQLVKLDSAGRLVTERPSDWEPSGAFYDVTPLI